MGIVPIRKYKPFFTKLIKSAIVSLQYKQKEKLHIIVFVQSYRGQYFDFLSFRILRFFARVCLVV